MRHGRAGTGSPSSSAPTVVVSDVWMNSPAIPMTGPRPHGRSIRRSRLRSASAAAIGCPARSSATTSARPGGLSWSNPSDVRSMTSCQARIDTVMVSVTRGLRSNDCGPPSGAMRRVCGPSPRSTVTIAGWAGRSVMLGVSSIPATSAGRGSFSVSVGGVLCCTSRCGAIHEVSGSPSAAAYAEPSTSIGSASPNARAAPGSAIRSASLGPCRERTHTVGVTAIGSGTVSVRLKLTGSSGDNAIAAAHRTPLGLSAQPGFPSSSEPRSHCATAESGGGPGTATVCRSVTGWAKPLASYWVIARSVMPNCTPEDPSSVATAVIRTHGDSPYGSAADSGLPASSKRSVDVPLTVSISMRRTCAPTAVALGVMVSVALVTGWSKSTCSHWPTAGCSALDTQLVDGSESNAAAGPVAGATLGSAVESADELDTD
ncbi:hypothetical protein JL15_24715, partial [Mycolicibacterium phlei DSM 43071]